MAIFTELNRMNGTRMAFVYGKQPFFAPIPDFTLPSSLPDASMRPLSLKSSAYTLFWCPSNSPIRCFVATCHSKISFAEVLRRREIIGRRERHHQNGCLVLELCNQVKGLGVPNFCDVIKPGRGHQGATWGKGEPRDALRMRVDNFAFLKRARIKKRSFPFSELVTTVSPAGEMATE